MTLFFLGFKLQADLEVIGTADRMVILFPLLPPWGEARRTPERREMGMRTNKSQQGEQGREMEWQQTLEPSCQQKI
jgi:hypothetical protein